jgi:protein arginine kinase activator
MLCENCKKNEATGYYKLSINGKDTTVQLCAKCLHETQKERLSFSVFSGTSHIPQTTKRRCRACGTDLQTIYSSLFVGCPQCYKEFSGNIDVLIKNIQPSCRHVGSSPSSNSEEEIERLISLAQKATNEGRLDDALAIKKRIKELKGE